MPTRPVKKASVPALAQPTYDEIVALTDKFCETQLTSEYQVLCRKLAGALARKRPSPLTRGKPEVWACAIVRVIGWVNFLDDSSQKPHLKLTAIDKAFGVGESTGQGERDALSRWFEQFQVPTPEEMALFDTPLLSDLASDSE